MKTQGIVVGLSMTVFGWLRGDDLNQTERSADHIVFLGKHELKTEKACW